MLRLIYGTSLPIFYLPASPLSTTTKKKKKKERKKEKGVFPLTTETPALTPA